VKGTLTAKDGAVTPVEFQLVKEQGDWRILFMEVRPAGAGVKEAEASGKGQDKDSVPVSPKTEAAQDKTPAGDTPELLSITTCEAVNDADNQPGEGYE
jgi:hypothetical protein